MKTIIYTNHSRIAKWSSMLLLVCALISGIQSTSAQTISSYTFAQNGGNYVPLGGTNTNISSTSCNDDANYSLVTLPFTFTYHGVPFSTIGISDNGYAMLGGTTGTYYSSVLGSQANTFAVFARDLYGCFSNGAILGYTSRGTAPNREFIIEWYRYGFYSGGLAEQSFQLQLLETSNTVRFVYGPHVGTTSNTVNVGLNGASVGDIQARTTSTDWTATASGSSTSTCTVSSTVFPPNGLTYQWTSAATVASMTFTSTMGSFISIQGAPTTLSSTGCNDDANYGIVTMPFSFTYHGAPFTTIGISDNGYVMLGGGTGTYYSSVLGSQANTAAVFARDLYGCFANGAVLSYKTEGTTPNRTFVVEWYLYGFYSSGLAEHTFQLHLKETSNKVFFVYGPHPGTSSNSVNVGLNGATTSDINARTTSTDWSATTLGTSSSTCSVSSILFPANGLTYTFTPPTCSTPTAYNVTGGGAVTCNVGVAIGLNGSQTSTTYQLKIGGVNTGSPLSGTGSALTFPSQTAAGTYTVTASSTVGTCSANMTGSVVVTVVPDITAPTISGCPSNISSPCAGVINYTNPTVTDNCSSSANVTQTFNYTGAAQTFTVPAGVTSIIVDAQGAQGGAGYGGTAGLGGRAQGTLTVTPGQVLQINVGGAGNAYSFISSGAIGGFNGGGGGGWAYYGGTGGGATDIRAGGTALANRVFVAGGGGGAGYDYGFGDNGGPGGASTSFAGAGYDGGTQGTVYVGYGGDQVAGGAGGLGVGPGTLGIGGAPNYYYGGSGGGGYYGGGAGYYGGAGGGSNFVGSASSVAQAAGFKSGNGFLSITYSVSFPAISQTAGLPSGASFPGGVTTNTFVAIDGSGNTATCSFTVTVSDIVAPVISGCPSNMTQSCPGVVTFTSPTVTDNCPGTVGISGSQTFTYTGAAQTFTVPPGITSITVDVKGAQGGNGVNAAFGGSGGRVQGTIAVTSGQVLNIYVGGAGGNCAICGTGGFNGGGGVSACSGQDAGTGGGASDIRVSPYALGNRLFVAGGGGGGGYTGTVANGGAGGGLTGANGGTWSGYQGGTGGSQIGGGVGGNGSAYGQPNGGNGILGVGGNGQGWCGGGGGAGGGYYGGGGGFIGGGGGGSNYADAGATSVTHTQGFNTGNGSVVISWNAPTTPYVIQTAGLPSGASYPNGVTTNTFSAVDASGNTASCTFTVSISDVTAPVISNCPSSVSFTCPQVVNYTTPTATDNCPSSASGSQTFNYTGNIVNYTVPSGITSLNITAKGAQGGGYSSATGGLGAIMTGTFAVTPGQVLSILVGQQPTTGTFGGGGGGTFVASGASYLTATPMLVAGGGGGASYSGSFGGNASTGTSGTGPLPGTGGNGAASTSCGGGGGGFFTSGGNDTFYGFGGGAGFRQGGAGGTNIYGYGPGGFGGGACPDYVGSCNMQAGAGGGYSGGSGLSSGAYQTTGYGGGSFNGGTSQSNSVANTGNGQVIISYSVSYPVITQTSGLPSGSVFAGVTTNVFTATDGVGNTSTCSFTVTANDNTPPVLTGCPSSVDIGCSGVSTFTAPTGTDDCPGTFTVTGGSQTYNYSGAIQTFIVPSGVTSLVITAKGAQGGTPTSGYGNPGGLGATIIGTCAVTPGATLKVLVGQQGGTPISLSGEAGGGGGSFVWDNNGNNLLVAAGGGGGSAWAYYTGSNASATTTPTAGVGAGSAAGGSGGNGGVGGGGINGGAGTPGSGGGGSGWLTNGGNGTVADMGQGGFSPLNGGAGGAAIGPYGAPGGFGGGGSGAGNGGAGGGGGGYNGGGGGNVWNGGAWGTGGGGGSFNGGSSQSNSVGNTGNGQVILSWPSINVPSPLIVQTSGLPSGSVFPVGVTTNVFTATDIAGNTTLCTFTITAHPSVVVTAMATPSTICPNGTSQLDIAGTTTSVSPGALFSENWTSSSFSTNGWSFDPSQSNWAVDGFGNYTPTGGTTPNAYFNWSPSILSYSSSLVSPVINAPSNLPVTMDYLLQLNNYSTATLEQFKVEYKKTTDVSWTLLENYTNTAGSFNVARTAQALTGMAGFAFQFRFTAYGQNSFNINGWGLDNIVVNGAIVTVVTPSIPLGTTFTWAPPTNLSATNIQNPVASNVTLTTIYTITAHNGTCDGPPSSVTLNVQSGNPVVSISSNQPTPNCPGNAVTLTANITNSVVAGRSLLWSTSETTNTISVSPTTATTYTVTVTDPCFGATASASFTVTVATIGTTTSVPGLNCGPIANTFASLDTYSGGNIIWQYQTPSGVGPWITIPGATTQSILLTGNIPAGGGLVTFGLRNQINGCSNVNSVPFVYTQDDPAAPTNVQGGTRCSNGGDLCVYADIPLGQNLEWWSAASGGVQIGSGNPFCYSPSVSGNIYAADRNPVTGCLGSIRSAAAVVVNPAPVIALNNSAPVICNPGSAPNSSTLDAHATNGVLTGGPNDYQVASIPWASSPSGSYTSITLGDDQLSGAIPIGFSFTFFGTSYTNAYISSNGFVSFDPGMGAACCTGYSLPSPVYPYPFIALAWEDFYPPLGGTIDYMSTGTDFYVRYNSIGHYSNGNNPLTGYVKISANGNIETHITSFNTDGDGVGETEGINGSGTLGFAVTGHNGVDGWSATNQSYIFYTQVASTFTYAWTPTIGLGGTTTGTLTGSDPTTVIASPAADQIYTVTFTNNATGCVNTATTSIISHKAPTITAQSPIAVNTDLGLCSAVVNYSFTITGYETPTVTHVFTGATSSGGSQLGDGSGTAFEKGVTNVTVTVANSCGSQSRTFTVSVTDNESPLINPVPDLGTLESPIFNTTGDCSSPVTITTPALSFYGDATTYTFYDNCPSSSVSGTRDDGDGLSSPYPVGTTTITWTAVDASGLSSEIVQYVTVEDNEVPSINCPLNITLSNTTGQCGRNVTYTATGSDNCGVQNITYSPTQGSFFPVGTTTVTATALDIHGNSNTCTFTVTINDTQPPTIVACAAAITFPPNTLNPSCHASLGNSCNSVLLGTVTATDNSFLCSPAGTLTIVPHVGTASGVAVTSTTQFNYGANTVYWTVTDAAGNSSGCTQTVTIASTTPSIVSVIPSSSVFFMGSTISVTATWISDCNQQNAWTMDWDDGTSNPITTGMVTSSSTGTSSITLIHTFPNSEVAEPKFSIRELCGSKTSPYVYGVSSIAYLIVSTNTTAKATAGGWYNFPSGGFPSSFVGSRMNVGDEVGPFGNNNNLTYKGEFQSNRHQINDFRVHTSNNHSASSMTYYVVQGCTLALFNTAARLNGNTGYHLTVWQTDKDIVPAVGNKIRVKVTQDSNGAIVFDTQLGANDATLPSTSLAQGTIKIHSNANSGCGARELEAAGMSNELLQNVPNPFNGQTEIGFTVPEDGHYTLKVYNYLGQEVSTLFNEDAVAGTDYKVKFDGSGMQSGIYMYTLSSENFRATKKMNLIK